MSGSEKWKLTFHSVLFKFVFNKAWVKNMGRGFGHKN